MGHFEDIHCAEWCNKQRFTHFVFFIPVLTSTGSKYILCNSKCKKELLLHTFVRVFLKVLLKIGIYNVYLKISYCYLEENYK